MDLRDRGRPLPATATPGRSTWSPALVEPSLEEGESLDATTLQPRRGDILGAGGAPLVTMRSVVRFGIDKTKVAGARAVASARALAGLLDIAPAPYAKLVRNAGEKAFVEALVLRESDAGQVDRGALGSIKGAVALGGEMPLAPTREFAAPILGRVGPATAEIVKKSDGAVQPGDEVGLSGLQARYDDQLGGTPGVVVSATGGTDERELFSSDEVNGEPLRTTLVPRLQTEAEAALGGVKPASAVVALRPSTGDILAAASGVGSDGYNTATFGQYAPGSTMKVVTALALLRAGVKPTDRVPCTPTLVVDGKTFKNYDDYPPSGLGDIPLRTAVANSCNTALISQYDRLGPTDLTEAAARARPRRRPRPRLPGVLRPGPEAGLGDRQGRLPHRAGQGARLPDGDGRGGGVRGPRRGGGARGCCRTRRRSRRRRRRRSPRPRRPP